MRMKKRMLSLALALVIALSCAPFAGAVNSETAGISPACALAYLDIVDRQARTYGGYASAKDDAPAEPVEGTVDGVAEEKKEEDTAAV